MLPGTLLDLATFTVVALVPGLPLSLLVHRRTRPGAAVVVVTAVGLGLGVWLLIGLPAVHHGVFERLPMAVAGLVVSAAAWIPGHRHVGLLRPGRPSWLSAVLALLAVPAVWLRTDPIYFAYQVADFGEYVNRGNVIADGGPFGGWFVNGFPLMMGESSLLLGEASTPDAMPFLGLLVAGGVLAVLQVVGAGRLVVAAVALPLALHVESVWFSQFPASETLYAALLVVSVLLATTALSGRDWLPAVAGGAFGFLLVLTRGNGLVYLPVVAAGLAVAPAFTDLTRTAVLRIHLVALASGLWLGSLYDARFNPLYFLDKQAAPRLPGPVADLFVRIDQLPYALAFTALVGVGIAAAAAVGIAVERWVGDRHGRLGVLRLLTIAAVASVVVGAHVVVISTDSYLPRYETLGVFVWVAVPLAIVVWLWRRREDLDGVTRFAIGWPLVVGSTMATFQASRIAKSMTVDAPWFLYWDRYFFSEAFPMVLLAGGAAAGVVVAAARDTPARAAFPAVVAVGALVALTGVVDMARPTRHATREAMFEDAYQELADLSALMPRDVPVVYHGLESHPPGWFWSNSSRVLADPLVQTFGHRVLNPAAALQRDPRPSDPEIAELLRAAGTDEGYVLQVSGDRNWRDVGGAELTAEVVGHLDVRIERLNGRSALAPEDQPWVHTTLHVRVVEVALDGSGAGIEQSVGERVEPGT